MGNEIGIIMAAGLGTRMQPITLDKPKPLVKVFGKPLIETVIEGLKRRDVSDIYVITGYLREQFFYLCDKYNGLHILENFDYLVKNNLSSLYVARDILRTADCFICEADLLVSDLSVFDKDLNDSCYYGKMVEGYSDDWIFEQQDDYISRIGKGGTNTYNMVGISFFKKDDAIILAEEIEKAYVKEENADLYWDEVVDRNIDKFKLKIMPVGQSQIVEIDTLEELIALDPDALEENRREL